MALCISNLAYSEQTKDAMFDTMACHGINHVETVFSKIKPWTFLTKDDIYDYKRSLEKHGFATKSAQSLFYGYSYTLNDIDQVLYHFERLISYSEILGIRTLVFGSPTMRKMTINYKENITTVFKILETMLIGTDITVAIEPNAKIYGGDYWHTVPEISEFLQDKYLRRIRTMVDYHNSILEDRDPSEDLLLYKKYISHVHISEPKLGKMQDISAHKKFSDTIKQVGYSGDITYEILESADPISSIKDFSSVYG